VLFVDTNESISPHLPENGFIKFKREDSKPIVWFVEHEYLDANSSERAVYVTKFKYTGSVDVIRHP
jgi:hypothetical protein